MIQIDWQPSVKNLRVFGIALAVFTLAIASWSAYFGTIFSLHVHPYVWRVLFSVSALSALLTAVYPRGLWPLYIGLTIAAFPIGLAVSFLAMSMVFFLVITPIGLTFRLLGRDLLDRRLDPSAPTYWRERRPMTDKKRYFRQF